MKRAFQLGIAIVLLVAFALPATGFNSGQALAASVSASGDHFKPSSPTPLGPPNDELRTPADYEAAAAAHPLVNSLVLVSRCRFAPF
ncbi:MAG TPA: hypothetical protein VF831_03750, partial [Anaerolineales bacterium]